MYNFGLYKDWNLQLIDKDHPKPDVQLESTESPDGDVFGDKLLANTKLSQYLPKYRKIFYSYDYGDNLKHYIEIDRVIENCTDRLKTSLR
jgi:hypothetical protein